MPINTDSGRKPNSVMDNTVINQCHDITVIDVPIHVVLRQKVPVTVVILHFSEFFSLSTTVNTVVVLR